MKRIRFTFAILVLLFIGTSNMKAQTVDDIKWGTYAKSINDVLTEDESSPKYILIYNMTKGGPNSFLANGDEYGMCGVLSDIGNRFYITKAEDTYAEGAYLIHANVNNEIINNYGNSLGLEKLDDGTKPYMDHGTNRFYGDVNNFPNWNITETSSKAYTFSNIDASEGNYANLKIADDGVLRISTSDAADEWYFILESDYSKAILDLAHNAYVNVTGLIHDGGFNRFNVYEKEWEIIGGEDGKPIEIDAIQANQTEMARLENLSAEDFINKKEQEISNIKTEHKDYFDIETQKNAAQSFMDDYVRKDVLEKKSLEDLTEEEKKELENIKERIGEDPSHDEYLQKEKERDELQAKLNAMTDYRTLINYLNDEIKMIKDNPGNEYYKNWKSLLTYYSHITNATMMEYDLQNREGEENTNTFPHFWAFGSPWEGWQEYGQYHCAGIYKNGAYKQTITGLPAGTYRIVCTAVNTGNETDINRASFFVNDKKLPIQVLRNEDKDKYEQINNEVIEYAKENMFLNEFETEGVKYQALDIYAAGKFLEENRESYTIDFYFTIEQTNEKGSGGEVTFGFSNDYEDGQMVPVFADNFQLFYTNPEYVAYISANNTNEEKLDKYVYDRPVDLYLRRSFVKGAWNSIVLPFDITIGSLGEGFGSDVKLSVLEGINPERTSQIRFVQTSTLKAGKCGLIYVPENALPVCATASDTKELNVLIKSLTSKDEGNLTEEFTAAGPLWLIKGVTREGTSKDKDGNIIDQNGDGIYEGLAYKVTDEYTTSAGTLEFEGYYVKPKDNGQNMAWPANSYVVDYGDMYYLDSEWGVRYATMWYLKDKEQSTSKLNFEINGVVDDATTIIEGVFAEGTDGIAKSNKVYGIDGQYWGTAYSIGHLPKGLYIINGKKYVAR